MVIIRKYPNIYRHGTSKTILYPGTNHVPSDKAAILLADPVFLAMEKYGAFEVQRGMATTIAKVEAQPIVDIVEAVKALNAKKAVEFVKGCLILDDLNKLLEAETRSGVINAIQDQIELVTPKKEEGNE